jgi:hypothetical protein
MLVMSIAHVRMHLPAGVCLEGDVMLLQAQQAPAPSRALTR